MNRSNSVTNEYLTQPASEADPAPETPGRGPAPVHADAYSDLPIEGKMEGGTAWIVQGGSGRPEGRL